MPNAAQFKTYQFIRSEITRLRGADSTVPLPLDRVTALSDDGDQAIFRVNGARVLIEKSGKIQDAGLPDCPTYASGILSKRFLPAIAADLLRQGNPHKKYLADRRHTPATFEAYLLRGTILDLSKVRVESGQSVDAAPLTPFALLNRKEPDENAEGSWRWAAENYLKITWLPSDRHFIRAFSGTITCEMLNALCVDYSVARTIPGHGILKYQVFVDMLNRHRNPDLTKENVATIIEKEVLAMQQAYGAGFLSAVTKAFWMMKQHPVVIYDQYAWKGLRRLGLSSGNDGYVTYWKAWFSLFDSPDTQRELDDALSWLPNSRFVQGLTKDAEVYGCFKDFAASESFRNRVVDRWLGYMGGFR
jgi:hypothetical protein